MSSQPALSKPSVAPFPGATARPLATALRASQSPFRSLLGLGAGGAVLAGCWLSLSGGEVPPWPLAAAAVFLSLATFFDVRALRIPNALTFPAMALGLAYHAAAPDGAGVLFALSGLGLGLVFLVAPYALGLLGAGDVKAAMALGAWWGTGALLGVLAWAAAVGGGLGLIVLLSAGELGELVGRWGRSLAATLGLRRIVYLPPSTLR